MQERDQPPRCTSFSSLTLLQAHAVRSLGGNDRNGEPALRWPQVIDQQRLHSLRMRQSLRPPVRCAAELGEDRTRLVPHLEDKLEFLTGRHDLRL